MSVLRRGGYAVLCLLLLAGCTSTPKPAPIGATQLGAAYGQLRRPAGSRLIATCGTDSLASEARSALSSWVAVLRHTDVCDMPTIRYYTTPDSLGAATGALSLLARQPGACGAEARQTMERVSELAAELRGIGESGDLLCGRKFVTEDTGRNVNSALNQQRKVEQLILNTLPEVGG